MAAACGVAELLGAAPVGLARRVRPPPDLPARIGPVELSMLGGMVAVRCPADLAPLMRRGQVGAGHARLVTLLLVYPGLRCDLGKKSPARSERRQ